MAVPTLNRDLVAVDQSIGGVVEMSVAESARHGDGGDRIESLNRIEKRRVREPGNVSDRTELTVDDAGQSTPRHPDAAGGGETQPRDATKGADREGTVGQVAEGIAQRRLASSPARYRLKAGGMQLPRLIRVAVERSAAEVLKKEIALGPELLEVESSETVSYTHLRAHETRH